MLLFSPFAEAAASSTPSTLHNPQTAAVWCPRRPTAEATATARGRWHLGFVPLSPSQALQGKVAGADSLQSRAGAVGQNGRGIGTRCRVTTPTPGLPRAPPPPPPRPLEPTCGRWATEPSESGPGPLPEINRAYSAPSPWLEKPLRDWGRDWDSAARAGHSRDTGWNMRSSCRFQRVSASSPQLRTCCKNRFHSAYILPSRS